MEAPAHPMSAAAPSSAAAHKLPACAICWEDPIDPVFLDDEDFGSELYCYDCLTYLLQSSSNNFTAPPRILGTPLPGTSCRLRRAQGNWIHNASYRDGYTQRVKGYTADWSPERQAAAAAQASWRAADGQQALPPAAVQQQPALFTNPLDGAVSSHEVGDSWAGTSSTAAGGRGRDNSQSRVAQQGSRGSGAANGLAASGGVASGAVPQQRQSGLASRVWAHIGRGAKQREAAQQAQPAPPPPPPAPHRPPSELAAELGALGDDLMQRGCPLDAIDLYQQACYALAGAPAEQQAVAKTALELCKAECKLSLKRYSATVLHTTAALQLAPDNVKALHLRGQALLAKVSPGEAGEREVSEAVLCLQRAAELAAAQDSRASADQVSAIAATLREARGHLATDSESQDGSQCGTPRELADDEG